MCACVHTCMHVHWEELPSGTNTILYQKTCQPLVAYLRKAKSCLLFHQHQVLEPADSVRPNTKAEASGSGGNRLAVVHDFGPTTATSQSLERVDLGSTAKGRGVQFTR